MRQKSELTWIGKSKHSRLEPRTLLENLKMSCHDKYRARKNDIFDNHLISGGSVKSQFHTNYKLDMGYLPDFVAETDAMIFMVET